MVSKLKAYTVEQIRNAERSHLEAGEPLMQRAASGLAIEIEAVLDELGEDHGRVFVLAGPGNNGGDALYAAAQLAEKGIEVVVLPVADRIHDDALAAAVGAGAVVIAEGERTSDRAAAEAGRADVIVDGILGTGSVADPALRGFAREAVDAVIAVIAEHVATVVAVDLPSGIGPDDGSVPDPVVVPANITVTFGGLKIGLFRQPGRSLAGTVLLVPVGIEADLDRLQATFVE